MVSHIHHDRGRSGVPHTRLSIRPVQPASHRVAFTAFNFGKFVAGHQVNRFAGERLPFAHRNGFEQRFRRRAIVVDVGYFYARGKYVINFAAQAHLLPRQRPWLPGTGSSFVDACSYRCRSFRARKRRMILLFVLLWSWFLPFGQVLAQPELLRLLVFQSEGHILLV